MFVFDDGPTAHTAEILTLLKKYQQRAVFFLIGERIDRRRDIVKWIADDGHEVGNHTMTHPRLPLLTIAEQGDEIARCRDTITSTIGREPRAFRPPFVAYTPETLKLAVDLGHSELVLASSIGDYRLDAEGIVARAAGKGFIGLHELPQTVEALPRLPEAVA